MSWNQITFQQYGENLVKQEFSDGLQISMNIKDIFIFSDNFITIYWEHSEHYTNLSTLNHNVRFLHCQHQGVGIMQYVYALNPVCIV